MNVTVSALLAEATAAAQPSASGSGQLLGMLPLFIVIGLMFFWMFHSQRKQARQRQTMLDGIKTGDRVVTAGGIYGNVTKITDKSFHLEIADKVEIEIDKGGVTSVQRPEPAK